MKTLTPAQPGARSSSRQVAAHSRACRRPRTRSRNACDDVRAFTLSASASSADRERIGVGHLEDGSDAAHHGAARTGLEIFLVRPAPARGNAPALSITPGRMCRPRAVDAAAGCGLREIADGGDAAVALTPMSRRPSPS